VARFVWRTRALRATTVMFMLFNVGEGALLVFLPVYSGQVGAGVAGYGLLVSAVTVGELAGSLGAGAVVVDRLGPRIVAAQVAAATLLAGLLLRPPLVVTLVLLAWADAPRPEGCTGGCSRCCGRPYRRPRRWGRRWPPSPCHGESPRRWSRWWP
jgi:MFS family permease